MIRKKPDGTWNGSFPVYELMLTIVKGHLVNRPETS